MGTWGSGNFESDTALDHLGIVIEELLSGIVDAMDGDGEALEPDEYWGTAVPCNLELLHVLSGHESVAALLPNATVIKEWKSTYMAVWEETIGDLEPTDDFKDERRTVLTRTFDQLAEVARAAHTEM